MPGQLLGRHSGLCVRPHGRSKGCHGVCSRTISPCSPAVRRVCSISSIAKNGGEGRGGGAPVNKPMYFIRHVHVHHVQDVRLSAEEDLLHFSCRVRNFQNTCPTWRLKRDGMLFFPDVDMQLLLFVRRMAGDARCQQPPVLKPLSAIFQSIM